MTEVEMMMFKEVVDARIENLKRNVEIASTAERKEYFKGRLMAYREIKNILETESGTLEYLWYTFVGE
jgi:hypothetical protein